ncbi:hypothetical protein BC332_13003 [Capsicum chinense]|nr:hypothetical protein BC332_13003 [Capsicum chinense]
MLQAIQAWLYECCSNVPPKIASKVDNRILRLLNWKTNAPRPHFEFLMDAMFKDGGKVVFKNIEPTQTKLTKFQIPQKNVIEDERSVDSDDDFQDPPPKQINEHSKKNKRSVHDIYSMDDPNLTEEGQEAHLNEYISGFRMHTAVPWHTVEEIYISVNIKKKHHWVLAVLSFSERCIFLYDSYESFGHYSVVLAQIKKLAEIIHLYLQSCDFYNKKGIDLQNHPKYKDKDYLSLFDMIFEENLPQQLSGSFYMLQQITYLVQQISDLFLWFPMDYSSVATGAEDNEHRDKESFKKDNSPSAKDLVKAFIIDHYPVRMQCDGTTDLTGDLVVKEICFGQYLDFSKDNNARFQMKMVYDLLKRRFMYENKDKMDEV